jgi:AAA family ATP:ADP antiporter
VVSASPASSGRIDEPTVNAASATAQPGALRRVFDVRDGEARGALLGFAFLLLLIIAGHTILEAARDALLLAGPGPRVLGTVYVIIATLAWPAAAVVARATDRFGAQRSLGGTLAVAACLPVVLFAVPGTPAAAMAVYVVSGLIGSIVVPQFWTLAGKVLTAAQGRRLFGLIAAAGVLGGVFGSGTATLVLLFLPVRALLLASAGAFVLAATALLRVGADERVASERRASTTVSDSAHSLVRQPLLARIALSVVVSTATLLLLDYCFKSTVARTLPGPQIGPFVARFYLALNALSLVVQVVLSSAVVRRLGVSAAIVLTPLLVLAGAAAVVVAGGALGAVLLMKTIDGSLRFSINRITAELIYLPVPAQTRQRVKPMIDGALARASQTLTGAFLLVARGSWLLAPRPLAALIAVFAGGWLAVAFATRKPYLGMLRTAIAGGSLGTGDGPVPLDLETAQLLVQHLASEDPQEVVGAMNALCRRGGSAFVPALVLLHPDEVVLIQALEHLAASRRDDWLGLARRLLADRRENVRMAAARALAMRGALDVAQVADDVGWRVRGYAAVDLALRDRAEDVVDNDRVRGLLHAEGDGGLAARLGMIAAIADAPPHRSLSRLLLVLAESPERAPEWTELVARAAARQHDPRVVPRLVDHLGTRDGREAIRSALVSFGDEGLEAVWWALQDASRPRSFRIHVPKTLARFGTRASAERLLECIETEEDGQVRYKAIRALEQLVTQRRIPLDRRRVEPLAREALVRHFRLLGARVVLGEVEAEAEPSAARRLLGGLLDDKLNQSLERALRLLAIARPREDFHRLRLACRSKDPYTRANAGELLDALFHRNDEQPLRALLRVVTEDLPAREKAERAAPIVGRPVPKGRSEALADLERDRDPVLVRLAKVCAGGTLGAGEPMNAGVAHA